MSIRLPTSCLVVLAGPSASGKTHWADKNFAPAQIVSSDRLRGLLGTGERDMAASDAAFRVLDVMVEERLSRGLLTVIDTLGMHADRRAHYRDLAARHGVPVYIVRFEATLDACKKRNRARRDPVPQRVLTDQHKRWKEARLEIDDEDYAGVFSPAPVRIVPRAMLDATEARRRQTASPAPLEFGLQLSSFNWEGHPETTRAKLTEIARTAEDAGFTSLWVMDHFRQIPQVGREWDDMLESYTTLGYLAAVTTTARLGALVTGLPYRNPAHLGKILATLDVLSGGRMICGLGLGWFEKEAKAYGIEFPSVPNRYVLLEDTIALLRQMWAAGTKPFKGNVVSVADTMCYPRPLQERVPILIGGSGEKRTLRLVAEHADMANLFGDVPTVTHKLDVLAQHCADVGRDVAEIQVTHLGPALVADDTAQLIAELNRHAAATPNTTPEMVAERTAAGTVDDHIGRYRAYAEAGVDHAIVTLADVEHIAPIETFAEVIAAFR